MIDNVDTLIWNLSVVGTEKYLNGMARGLGLIHPE